MEVIHQINIAKIMLGGIVGYNNGSYFENCINNGNINCDDNKILYLGGISGYNEYWNYASSFGLAKINLCNNNGNVISTSTSSLYVGGISGYNEKGTEILESLNSGTVSGVSSKGENYVYVGEISGYTEL